MDPVVVWCGYCLNANQLSDPKDRVHIFRCAFILYSRVKTRSRLLEDVGCPFPPAASYSTVKIECMMSVISRFT
jgi:hypothetical protein